jgi:DNA mismatch repair protein MutL
VAVSEPEAPFQSQSVAAAPAGYFSSLSVIGQFHGEYILCQSGTDLVIIDQHAASERVAYQRLKQQCLSGVVESQRLLFPETVELTFGEVAVARRFHAELAGIGFELEPFGGATLMVSAVPRLADGGNAISLVREILSDLAQLGTSAAFQELLDGLLARIACHSVVRGVHPLEARQICELLRSMDETEFAASCPHGRPVSHGISLADVEKIFKRT